VVDHDEVLDALEEVCVALSDTIHRCTAAIEQAAWLQTERRAGKAYHEILGETRSPLIVELVSATLASLQETGHKLRSAEASALYAEGLTMTRIARLFGVSHQRISALIRERRGA